MTTIIDRLNENINIINHSCLNLRHKDSNCSRCMESCEAHAITITSYRKRIIIDWQKCINCLACSSVCPTEVFWPKSGEVKIFLEDIIQKLNAFETVDIGCRYCKKQIDDEDIVYIPSLRMISYEYLVIMALKGAKTVKFFTSNCSICPVKDCKTYLKIEIEKCEKFLDAINRGKFEASILNISEYEKRDLKRKKEKYSPVLSRRELFGFFKQRTKESLAIGFGLIDKGEKQSLQVVENYRLPKKRGVLLDTLQKMNIEISQNIIDKLSSSLSDFGKITIDFEKCKKCEVCAKLCPTGALMSNKLEGDKKEILFNAPYCINCGICNLSCRYKAIKAV